MVEVEEGRLRALQQQVPPGVERVVQQVDRVGDVRGDAVEQITGITVDQSVDVEAISAQHLQMGVFGRGEGGEALAEGGPVEQIARTDADPAGLVRIRRSDPFQRGADPSCAPAGLGQRIVGLMPGKDQMGMARQLELRAVDAPRLEGLDLAGEVSRVDDDTIGDDRDHMVVEDTRRHELQREPLTIDDDGVPGVVPTLVAHDEVVLLGELVGDLRLPLVPPLGTHDDSYRHVDALYVVGQTSRWSVPSTT